MRRCFGGKHRFVLYSYVVSFPVREVGDIKAHPQVRAVLASQSAGAPREHGDVIFVRIPQLRVVPRIELLMSVAEKRQSEVYEWSVRANRALVLCVVVASTGTCYGRSVLEHGRSTGCLDLGNTPRTYRDRVWNPRVPQPAPAHPHGLGVEVLNHER